MFERLADQYSIGIDPGKSTGFAVYSIAENQLSELQTVTFWDAYNQVVTRFKPEQLTRVVIEVPNSKHVWHKAASSLRALQRQGADVGGVVREAELLADGLERAGYPVTRAQPRKKLGAEVFKNHTGWRDRSNQHCRDAAMLCWGR
ncbi:MAG: hypothetical protein M3H12_19980 [Chromatiales bacterium]|nr:hypothetical protein [Gammaproteobacteria bacterium]